MLEVFREEDEAVFVRKDDHVFFTFAISFVMPGEGEKEGGIAGDVFAARFFVHDSSAAEDFVEIDALEGHGDEADGGKDRSAAADPVFHGEGGEEALFFGEVVELGAVSGDGDGVFGEVESGCLEGLFGFEHAIAGFGSAAGFGNDDRESGGESVAELGERFVDASRVGVVEEVGGEGRVGAEGIVDELWAEGRTADADDEEVFEGLAVGCLEFASDDFLGEGFDVGERLGDLRAEFVVGCESRIAEPVVADHAAFIGVSDGAGLEGFEVGEGFGNF